MTKYLKIGVALLFFVLVNIYWGLKYSSSVESPLKFGSVDLQRAAQESLAGKEAFAKLQKDFNKKKGIIERRQKEIKGLEEELSKQSLILTAESKKEKEDVYRKKLKELQRYVDDSNQELQNQQRELTKKILIELIKIVDKLGEEQQYTLILERQEGILYASKNIDLTDDIRERYDQLKAEKVGVPRPLQVEE